MLFHVVWTTSGVWSPADPRGDWDELSHLYVSLVRGYGVIRMSHPLDRAWKAEPPGEGAVELARFTRTNIAREIRELAESDRVAGETQIRALAVQPHAVQIVLACPEDALRQRVGRLKSRTSSGKGMWSRGFWWAKLENRDVLDAVGSFVAAADKISP